jgi:hypothetical protein
LWNAGKCGMILEYGKNVAKNQKYWDFRDFPIFYCLYLFVY